MTDMTDRTDMKKEKGIKTENLNIGYDSDLIRDITLSVQPGSIVTLIGPNGCGDPHRCAEGTGRGDPAERR